MLTREMVKYYGTALSTVSAYYTSLLPDPLYEANFLPTHSVIIYVYSRHYDGFFIQSKNFLVAVLL